jgi:hypothetical protein
VGDVLGDHLCGAVGVARVQRGAADHPRRLADLHRGQYRLGQGPACREFVGNGTSNTLGNFDFPCIDRVINAVTSLLRARGEQIPTTSPPPTWSPTNSSIRQ